MLSEKIAKSVYYLGFLIIFLILALFISRQYLYLDDVSYIFPAITGQYQSHFSGYIRDNGFNRPFALFYYYLILGVFTAYPSLAHLIPLIAFIFGGYLLFKILIIQGLSKNNSFLTSILILCLPFAAEIYSWLSASIGIWALLIFYLEILLLEKFSGYKINLILIFLLQSIVSLLYETTIFMAIPLAYASIVNTSSANFNYRKFFKNLIIFIFPAIIYLSIKVSVPHAIPGEFEVSKFSEVFRYFGNYISQFYELFITKGLFLFWFENFYRGIRYVFYSVPAALLMFLLILILFRNIRNLKTEASEIITDEKLKFWFLALFSSSLPLIWKKYYLPFRTLYLPVVIFIIILAFSISNYVSRQRNLGALIIKDYSRIIKSVVIIIALILLVIQIAMIKNYQLQYSHDLKIIEELRIITEKLGYNSRNRTNLVLRDMPKNTLTSYNYGDYLFSMFYNDWTAIGFVDLNSGTVRNIAVEITGKNVYSSKIDKESFMKLRPLTILKFNGIENCYIKRCFLMEKNEK